MHTVTMSFFMYSACQNKLTMFITPVLMNARKNENNCLDSYELFYNCVRFFFVIKGHLHNKIEPNF